jgi:hypothetical protein
MSKPGQYSERKKPASSWPLESPRLWTPSKPPCYHEQKGFRFTL